jgi:hypothetical protein
MMHGSPRHSGGYRKDVYQRVLEVVGGSEPVESFRGVRFDEDKGG